MKTRSITPSAGHQSDDDEIGDISSPSESSSDEDFFLSDAEQSSDEDSAASEVDAAPTAKTPRAQKARTPGRKTKRKEQVPTDPMKGKDGTVWRQEQVGAPLQFTPTEPYAADGEPTAEVKRNVRGRLTSFLTFFSLSMMRLVLQCTVQHGRETDDKWFMDIPELMAFIAIVILRGVNWLPSLADCWTNKFGNHLAAGIMARDRFVTIMRHLRFDDPTTREERFQTDKFAAISELWQDFVGNCVNSYIPGRHITVDEQLFPTKSRCAFLQYIASKPDKFGIKFWVACDLKTKYICNVQPYLGTDPARPRTESVGERVVMTLMQPFLGKGRTVTTDNYFTSLSLARRLLACQTTLLGTLGSNRWEIPPSARKTHLRKYDTEVFTCTDASLTVYAAKHNKTVYVLSSMHSTVATNTSEKRKPSTIMTYNSTKCGVDVMDQMVRQYTARRPTRRWPVAVFYNLIDMAALNAYVIYRECMNKQERRVVFLAELAKELAQRYVGERRARSEMYLRPDLALDPDPNSESDPDADPETDRPSKRENTRPAPTLKPTLTRATAVTCQVKSVCKKNHATAPCVSCNRYCCGTCQQKPPRICTDCGARSHTATTTR